MKNKSKKFRKLQAIQKSIENRSWQDRVSVGMSSQFPTHSFGGNKNRSAGFGTQESSSITSRTLYHTLLAGSITEISGTLASLAFSLLSAAQIQRHRVVWVQPQSGLLYPPSLFGFSIDFDSFWVVQTPDTQAHKLRTAELLLRSGAFDLIVVDMRSKQGSFQQTFFPRRAFHNRKRPAAGCFSKEKMPPAFQNRLLGLAKEHNCRLVFLTHQTPFSNSKTNHSTSSFCDLSALRFHCSHRWSTDFLSVAVSIEKDKKGLFGQRKTYLLAEPFRLPEAMLSIPQNLPSQNSASNNASPTKPSVRKKTLAFSGSKKTFF